MAATATYTKNLTVPAVLASIDRFKLRLKDIGNMLWDETRPTGGVGKRVWGPKAEAAVSQLLKDHLERDFGTSFVVNREVQVRQTSSKGHGLAVDVLVNAPAGRGGRVLVCPIEVKGSWNADLFTDLRSQLVDDYLPAVGSRRGIYLCAFFPLDEWDDHDHSGWQTAAGRTQEQIVSALEAAALDASVGGIVVAARVVEVPRAVPSKRASGKCAAKSKRAKNVEE